MMGHDGIPFGEFLVDHQAECSGIREKPDMVRLRLIVLGHINKGICMGSLPSPAKVELGSDSDVELG
ncbi:hypothetical protein [Bifidobacterium catulorum]|uniref:hypothetical protein n=1 Tax=Bifidobacterium catulorum TaxID=1630173 RepID=UPI0011B24517|nr:hypothetical protein [Bifidobacterium catulorum]